MPTIPTRPTGPTTPASGSRPDVVYLDHAASTPLREEAVAAVTAQLRTTGNPSALHGPGRAARKVVEESREQVAAVLGVRPAEVLWTSGGTESDNLAVKGGYWARRDADPRRIRVLVSAVEHHAVLDAAHWLAAHEGAVVELVPVDRTGRVELDALQQALARDPGSVALVSVMAANNEVGTVQPLAEVTALAHAAGAWVHTDAVQAVGQLPLEVTASGVDLMSLTGHKLGGPVGVGALLARRGVEPTALLHGGGQQREVRSGTLDAAGAAGLVAALTAAVATQEAEAARLAGLRDDLVRRTTERVPGSRLNGAPLGGDRLPGNAHLSFPGCEGDALLLLLDAAGIAASTGSACSAGVAQASHVLVAAGLDPEEARSSLRLSLGHTSTPRDVDAFVDAVGPAVERARAAADAVRATSTRRTPAPVGG